MRRTLAMLAALTAPLLAVADNPSGWKVSTPCATSGCAKKVRALDAAIDAVRADGHVFKIGDNHYLAFAVERTSGEDGWIAMFYGDARTLYRMPNDRDVASGTDGVIADGWVQPSRDPTTGIEFTDARFGFPRIRLHRTRDITVECGPFSFQTTELPNGRELLRKAKLLAPLRKERVAHRLARGEGTTYYYTDVEAGDPLARSPQIYIGKRGAMKRVKLVDFASDRAGQVFVTAAGTLHVDHIDKVGNDIRMSWTAPGKPPVALREVPLDPDLVFGDLGVYDGQRWNTPCDDLPLH